MSVPPPSCTHTAPLADEETLEQHLLGGHDQLHEGDELMNDQEQDAADDRCGGAAGARVPRQLQLALAAAAATRAAAAACRFGTAAGFGSACACAMGGAGCWPAPG
jgi:hypothetical protein